MTQINWTIVALLCTALALILIWIRKRYVAKSIEEPGSKSEDKRLESDLFNKIVKCLQEDQLFLNKNLKLSELAVHLDCNERLLSRSINLFGGGNFNKFINSFRVEFSKEILIGGQYDHYTIEAIAEEAGFSNKVSFYNAFKSETGMSPTQFREVKQSKTQ